MNDVISRHGVSAWLDNMGYPKLADAIMDEKRFPSAQSEQQWIPCSERLPENGRECLYCTDMGIVRMGFYFEGYDFEHGFEYGYDIVAWMPLPEPPKED